MPIYYKDAVRGWQYTGARTGTPWDSSFFYNDNGTWRDVKSAWIKYNGKWHQIYERKNSEIGLTKVFNFIGDSMTWGYGLPVNQQFPTLIQNHLDYCAGASTTEHSVVRSILPDDSLSIPFNGGYNGIPKYSKSSGVIFTEEGPFKNYKGWKGSGSYVPPAITIPSGEYIEFPIPNNTRTILTSLTSEPTNGPFELEYRFTNGTLFKIGSTYVSNYVSGGGGGSGYVELVGGNYQPIIISNSSERFRLTCTSGTLRIRSIDFAPIVDNGFVSYNRVQVTARNSYAVEDYINNTDEIKKACLYKWYYGANAKPTYIISAGFEDIYERSKTAAQYKADLIQLATNLLNNSTSDQVLSTGEVILTIPLVPVGTAHSIDPRQSYNDAVVEAANQLGLHYVDLSCLNLTSSHFVSDGRNLNAAGALKVANKYIEDLGFGEQESLPTKNHEYIAPWRGVT